MSVKTCKELLLPEICQRCGIDVPVEKYVLLVISLFEMWISGKTYLFKIMAIKPTAVCTIKFISISRHG